ncbi:SRPBCC family protein [Nocardia mangyaensis]|uniref:SRPBCC family protein n=1 Tax=Nocardia mangyaensis TaxID=2213200 RepID=UPI002676B017|nr:SRPBCC family protein [Nocardia mangyaensis]MDO3647009.1 SRPBCC family protein [Nocardia mangyaensis]
MSVVEITVPTSVPAVFEVLADGWSYAGWVVGASHIRKVDLGWPAVGTRIHHSVGPWPLTVQDTTVVRAVDRPNRLELRARLWPFGAATVTLELAALDDETTAVRMTERVIAGPGRWLPQRVQALLLGPRNRASLAMLTDIAVGRARARR